MIIRTTTSREYIIEYLETLDNSKPIKSQENGELREDCTNYASLGYIRNISTTEQLI